MTDRPAPAPSPADVLRLVEECVAALNELLPAAERLAFSPTAPLYDGSGAMDSLSLVNFIVIAEGKIKERFGVDAVLYREHTLENPAHPFRNVQAFAEHVRGAVAAAAPPA